MALKIPSTVVPDTLAMCVCFVTNRKNIFFFLLNVNVTAHCFLAYSARRI